MLCLQLLQAQLFVLFAEKIWARLQHWVLITILSRDSRQSLGDKAFFSMFSLRAGFSIPSGVLGTILVHLVISSFLLGKKVPLVRKPQPAQWLTATDGSASPSSVEQPASAGWGFVVDRVGCLSGVEVECWGEVLTDDRDPRASGADSLTNNAGELWALAEAFLWLRDESGDYKFVAVTVVYDSVAKGLVTEPWAPQSHLKRVSLLRDLYVEACDSRVVSWVHVRSHGRETDPAKQHLLPLNERADRLAERGRSGEPCLFYIGGSTPSALMNQSFRSSDVDGVVEFSLL